jgi:nucleoside-diphosphate-sugar epimerase
MSRVLITGATGFIGTAGRRALVRAGYEVHAISSHPQPDEPEVVWHRADLLADHDSERVLVAVRPELLLHFAWYAEHGRFWTSIENVRWAEATLRLMRAFAQHGGRRAVLAGTCAEYEWTPAGGVLSETRTPLRPASLYGSCKNATRLIADALAMQVGIELAWGRIFFLYGPGEPATRLVPAVARALIAGEPVPVADGKQVRDFMYVDDVAEAFVSLLASDVQGPVNIGSGDGISLRALVELVGAAAGGSDLIQFGALPRRPGEPASLIADVGRLRVEVRFEPRVRLEDGVAATVDWWTQALANGSSARSLTSADGA